MKKKIIIGVTLCFLAAVAAVCLTNSEKIDEAVFIYRNVEALSSSEVSFGPMCSPTTTPGIYYMPLCSKCRPYGYYAMDVVQFCSK